MARPRLSWLLCAGVAAALCGCPSAGLYRSARTLEPRETDLGINLSAARAAWAASSWSDGTGSKPKSAGSAVFLGGPEVHAHRGLLPDLEAGGRIALGGPYVEIDGKYRFLHQDQLHLAVAPLAGWTPGYALRGGRIALPLLASWDFTENWGVSAGIQGGYRWANPDPLSVHVQSATIDDLRWASGTGGWNFGGGLSVDWRGDNAYVRPAIEVVRSTSETPGVGADYGIATWNVTLSAGWTFGRNLAALDNTAKELDKLLQTP